MNNTTQIGSSKNRRLSSSPKETDAKFPILRDSTITRPSGSTSLPHHSPFSSRQSKRASEEHSDSSPYLPCPPCPPPSPNPNYSPCPPSRTVSKTQEMLFTSRNSSFRPVPNSRRSM